MLYYVFGQKTYVYKQLVATNLAKTQKACQCIHCTMEDFDTSDDDPNDHTLDKLVMYRFYEDFKDFEVESLIVTTRGRLKHALGHEVGIWNVLGSQCEASVRLRADHFDEIAELSDFTGKRTAVRNLVEMLPIGFDVVKQFFDNLDNQDDTYCACKRCVAFFKKQNSR